MDKNIKNLPLVVIFGQTNAGKSTLFNRLTEKQQALISNIPGTTRDSNIGQVKWRGKFFTLVDTGGILDLKYLTDKKATAADIEAKVQKGVRSYLGQADLILFLTDVRAGILPPDKELALFLKKRKVWLAKTILVANKSDRRRDQFNVAEFHRLGLGQPQPISAATGAGTGDLLDIIIKKIKGGKFPAADEGENKPDSARVCLIGKPNVGKSSLLNAILGYERVIVSPVPHTTREPQNTDIVYNKEIITIIDTAGISRKGNKSRGLEKDGIAKSLASLSQAEIALLVLDISRAITHQDLKLVEEIVNRKVSLIIIANKWDLMKKDNDSSAQSADEQSKKYTRYIYNAMPFVAWAPIHFTSALTGRKVNKILDLIIQINAARRKEISASQLNKFLATTVKIHLPAKARGTKHPRIYELKQIKINPPKFELQIGPKDSLHFSYVRFIENRLREKFGFLGTPLTIRINRGRQVHGKHELRITHNA